MRAVIDSFTSAVRKPNNVNDGKRETGLGKSRMRSYFKIQLRCIIQLVA
jgi:hypothetical protein